MTRELAVLEVGLVNVDINSGYASCSYFRNKSQIPDAAREKLPPTPATSNTYIDEVATSSNLCSPLRDSSELITLSDAGQNSTRMQCYFYCLWNHFLDYFNEPVQDGAVMYTGDVPFQYRKQEVTTELSDITLILSK